MNWFTNIIGATSGSEPSALPDNAIIFDVRSPGEFAGGHLDGALNLPLDDIERQIGAVVADRHAPIVLCCASGMRSGAAQSLLVRLGYTQVSNGGGAGALALRLGKPIVR